MNDAIHQRNGTPLSTYAASVANELQVDAVGLWQVFNTLRRGFGLEDLELAVHVRKCIEALFAAGAVPVVGSAKDKAWYLAGGFGQQGDAKVEAVLLYIRSLGRDPDVGDLWFALPKFARAAE